MMILRKALLYWGKHRRRFGLQAIDSVPPCEADYRRLAGEVDQVLMRDDVAVWYPRAVDTVHGGFTAGYSETWQPVATQSKAIVFQSRMSWFAAQVSERLTPDAAAQFQGYARHGVKFLREKLWDSERGGFFWNLTREGALPAGDPGDKHAYGLGFGIYACANVARVTGDPEALALAQESFRWLDERAHDSTHGGYYEDLDRDGKALPPGPPGQEFNLLNTPRGYKASNTQIHILEAFTELYRVWPDPLVRSRLGELFLIIRDTMVVPPGCLNNTYTMDFRSIPGLDSYGHDVETAFLLIDAARALGNPEDASTWEKGRLMVDNALHYGLDGVHGGFFSEGPAFRHATGLEKAWWAQAEALHALLFMHERFGTEDLRYWTAFVQTWRFICRYQLDSRNRGWHQTIWADNKPIPELKGHNWKDPYHSGRALLNAAEILRRLGKQQQPLIQA